MEPILEKYLHKCIKIDSKISGIVKSEEKFLEMQTDLKSKGYSYSIKWSDLKKRVPDKKMIRFEESLGLPYTNGNRMYLDCVHGDLYYKSNKQDQSTGKKSRISKDSKKLGCQSKISVKLRHVFTDYVTDEPRNLTKWQKIKISKELHDKISAGSNPRQEPWYYIDAFINHNHDITVHNLEIHPEIKSKIVELVKNGLTSVRAIKEQLSEKVQNMFKDKQAPDSTNSAFYPSHSVIYSHVYRTLRSMQDTSSNQGVVELEWCNEVGFNVGNGMDPTDQVVFFYEEIVENETTEIIPSIDSPSVKNPSEDQLLTIRKKLNNILDLTFNLPEDENYEGTIEQLAKVEEVLLNCRKKKRKRENSQFIPVE